MSDVAYYSVATFDEPRLRRAILPAMMHSTLAKAIPATHEITSTCASDPVVPIATTPAPSKSSAAAISMNSANMPDAKAIHL